MSDPSMQDSLFPDPLGLRLRAAREQAGLTPEQAAAQLRLPLAIVEAMEREDWDRLGAPIYVRSYVGSYLKLLGLPQDLLELAKAQSDEPKLVTLAPRSRMRHTVDASVRNVVYLVMTAVLVVPVYLVARHYQQRDRVQDLTLDAGIGPDLAAPASARPAPPAVAVPADVDDAATAATATQDVGAATVAGATGGPVSAGVDAPAVATSPDPVMASLAPFPKAAPTPELVLTFRGESWIDVVGPDGARIERGLVPAGAERRYDAGQIVRITLGNADGVDVVHGGRGVDLTPFRSANVARFAVSSDGAPTPAAN